MKGTSYIGGIVKILETPKSKVLIHNIFVTKVRAQWPQRRKDGIVTLRFWGNLAQEASTSYQTNDYILIEGYVSSRSRKQKPENLSPSKSKKIEITVLKVYPIASFPLDSTNSVSPT